MSVTLLKSKQIPLEFQTNPKKFKKYHKIKYKVLKTNSSTLSDKGSTFKTTKHAFFSLKQIVTILKLLKPNLKSFRLSRIKFKVKFDTILTKKPKDIRMGRGKGAPSERVFNSQGGKTIFSLYGLPLSESKRVLFTCSKKLPNIQVLDKVK